VVVAGWCVAVLLDGRSPHPALCRAGTGQDHAVYRDKPAYREIGRRKIAIGVDRESGRIAHHHNYTQRTATSRHPFKIPVWRSATPLCGAQGRQTGVMPTRPTPSEVAVTDTHHQAIECTDRRPLVRLPGPGWAHGHPKTTLRYTSYRKVVMGGGGWAYPSRPGRRNPPRPPTAPRALDHDHAVHRDKPAYRASVAVTTAISGLIAVFGHHPRGRTSPRPGCPRRHAQPRRPHGIQSPGRRRTSSLKVTVNTNGN
jgi:hypothetical protein